MEVYGDTSRPPIEPTPAPAGAGPSLVREGQSKLKPPLSGDLMGDGGLVIRSFQPGDNAGVQRICFTHFRSLCLAAIRYYVAEHFQDLAVLFVLGICFLRLPHLVLITVLFHFYLFMKSRWEMEQYIRRDCQDLKDVQQTYLNADDRCHFWVAEVTDKDKAKSLVGCVGLVPSRENAGIAKLVRLVVDGSHRRMRIGSRLLLQLEMYARDHQYESVRIYTNTLNPSHMKFVRQHGYTIVQTIRRGLMRGDLVTWHKSLVTPEVSGDQDQVETSERQVDVQMDLRIRSAAQQVMD